jgi:hypothetical protein
MVLLEIKYYRLRKRKSHIEALRVGLNVHTSLWSQTRNNEQQKIDYHTLLQKRLMITHSLVYIVAGRDLE